ncbi:coiled-coil domain-containing protein 85C-A-like [Diadema antillarum]|uniref:coiled-coil domain-containing protein 85C-A-like n=1 Tax=Diadema antillarum TaxID=105358 RepID=UPI003A8C3F85
MAARNISRFTSDEELKTLSFEDVVRRLRWCETERVRLLNDHANSVKELRHQLQLKTNELQHIKAENQKLLSDNQELRDLCCFLDDDRQKGRKMSTEWQRFGQYTTSVMRNGVSTYQDKLRELEERQQQLLRDNLELRELCFLLDQERTGNQSTLSSLGSLSSQDGGEGNSMVNGPSSLSNDVHMSKDGSSKVVWGNGVDYPLQNNDQSSRVSYPDERIRSFNDKGQYSQSEPRRNGPVSEDKMDDHMQNHVPSASNSIHSSYPSRNYGPSIENGNVAPNSPKAMVNALKVLEVHDMLERQTPPNHLENDHMNTNEKAIVREMCNVVWRKLGDNPGNANGAGGGNGGGGSGGGGGQSNRPPAPPRYPSSGVNPPVRPSGFTTPPYSGGSTSSLEKKGI